MGPTWSWTSFARAAADAQDRGRAGGGDGAVGVRVHGLGDVDGGVEVIDEDLGLRRRRDFRVLEPVREGADEGLYAVDLVAVAADHLEKEVPGRSRADRPRQRGGDRRRRLRDRRAEQRHVPPVRLDRAVEGEGP